MVTESLEDKKAAFSAEEFQKKLLKGNTIECLKDFIARARDPDDTDVVGEFVHDASTKDGSVIIGLLRNNRPPSELATIFEALQEVFLRVAGDLNSYSPWALTLIRQILQGDNLFHVYRGLSLGNTSNEIICTLRFLTSMVMSSSLAAKEVFTNLNWRKEVFSKLLTRVNVKTVKDVRACLIELLISFLISGNLTLKRQFIESSELLGQVFSGLPDDKCSTIETFLRAITSHVVEEKYIPKTIKIRLLNLQTLSFVMKLFKWKGTKTFEKKFQKKSERLSLAEKEAGGEVVTVSSEDEVRDVHQLAKEFLVAVCCSHKNGIVFKDKLMGTGDRNVNHTITGLLTNSEKPFTIPVMEKTFEEMLTSCPDQICVYFKKLVDTLQPRSSEQFFAAMSFVTRVLDSVDLVNVINTADCSVSVLKLVQMFLNVCCTNVLFSDSLKRMLRHLDISIRHHCLCYMEVVLKKMKKLLDEDEDEAKLLKSKIVRFQDFKDKFSQRILNLLPSLEDVVSCYELVTKVKPSLSEEELSEEALREFSLYNHLQLLVNVMNLYTQFVPVTSEHSSGHMSGLLASLGNLHSILQPEDAVDIQIRILKHLEENVKGSSLLLEKIKDKSVIVMLLEILLATNEAVTKRKTVELLKKMLISTLDFSSNEDEVDIWLKHLDMRLGHVNEIAPFFQDICQEFASNPMRYTSKTKSLIRKFEGSNINDEEQAYYSILDEIMGDGDVVEQTPFKVSDVGAFSPLVIVGFRLLESYSQVCAYYLCSVLFDIFHTRPNPDPLFQLIQRNINRLPQNFNMYQTYFQEKASTRRSNRPASEITHVRHFTRECFTGESSFPAKIEKSLRRLIANLDRDQSFLLSREVLTYIHFLFKTKRDDCEGLTNFYYKILKIIIRRKYDDDSNVLFPLYHQSVAEHLLQRPTIQQSFLSGNHWNLTQLALFTLKHEPNIARSTKKILQTKVEEFLQQEVVSNDLPIDLSSVCEPFLSDFEWRTLNRLMVKLSQLQTSDLLNDDTKLNSSGTLLIKLLDRVSSLHCQTAGSGYVNHAIVNADVISSLFRIYIELNQTEAAEELATALLTFFEREPLYWFLVNEEVSAKLLLHMESDATLEMVRRLCQYSVTHLEAVENWLLASTDFDGRFQDMVLHYMKTLNWLPWRPYNSESILTTTAKHFWPRIVSSFQDGSNELEPDFVHSFVKLSSNNQFIDMDDLLQYCNRYSTPAFISATDSRFLSNSKWIYERLSVNGILINEYHPLAVWIFSWLQFLLKSLTNESDVRMLAEIIEDAEKLPDLGKVLHQEKMWHRLIKTTLKSGLRDKDGSHIVKLLTAILRKLKLNGELWSIHCTSIYSLVIGHSNFIPGILEISNSHLEWKMNVIDLLTLLVETEKSCCDSAYVPALLSAYGATLRLLDQKILHLIYLYEENGVDVHSFRPFLWGPTAIGHYSVNKNVTHSLWKQPTMDEVLNLLDKELMMETAFKFPLQLELQPKATEVETNARPVYDPRFLQSLLSNVLAPESLVNCNKFIESNGLAFLLASLSSVDVAMRSAGYHNISLFYQHLEGSRYHRKSQWLLMLDCLRNSVTEENMQLPSLISVFFVRCCQLVENPADLMSRPIVNFLLLKPKLDLGVVPEFITLFNSGDIKDHELHRSWMLTFMNLGFRSNADYMLCRKRYVFKLTMAYFDSPLASANGRLLVLELLKQASTVETVAVQLVNRHGLFAFIASAIMHKNEDIISSCIEILYNIWNSKSSDSFIISETLTLLLTALNSISHQQPLVIIEKYLRTLAYCLLHVKTESMIFQSKLTIAHMKHLLDIGKDVAARTADQLQDDVQTNFRSSCVSSMCDIIMDWQCDGDVELFVMLFDFLSKNVPANNADKSKAMLKWMGNHLKHLPPSAVTSGLFDHLLGCYKTVLFGNMEKVGRRPKQLRALNETFHVVIEKLYAANENDKQQNPLFGHLASDKVHQIFQNPSLKQLMDVKDKYSKDFILGLFACKSWTLSDQVDQLPYYMTSRKHSRGHKRSSIEIDPSPKKKRKSKQT